MNVGHARSSGRRRARVARSDRSLSTVYWRATERAGAGDVGERDAARARRGGCLSDATLRPLAETEILRRATYRPVRVPRQSRLYFPLAMSPPFAPAFAPIARVDLLKRRLVGARALAAACTLFAAAAVTAAPVDLPPASIRRTCSRGWRRIPMIDPLPTFHPVPTTPRERLPARACDAHCHVFGPAAGFRSPPTRPFTPPTHRRDGCSRCTRCSASSAARRAVELPRLRQQCRRRCDRRARRLLRHRPRPPRRKRRDIARAACAGLPRRALQLHEASRQRRADRGHRLDPTARAAGLAPAGAFRQRR